MRLAMVRVTRKLLAPLITVVCCITINAQQAPTHPFPEAYFTLTTDTARMRFLMKAISDSLNEGQLNSIYDWSVAGLAMAQKNRNDTMTGIFYFDIGKAYAYKILKPDSAVYFYKKVLPFFPDKLKYYNLYATREIMERYSEAGNKDSSLAYLDSLHARIDSMRIDNPRRMNMSQNMAGVYRYFGMFKSATRLYQDAIEGYRIKGNKGGLGMAMANLGELFDEAGDDLKAIYYSRQALDYLEIANMPYMLTAANLATYYSNLGKYDSTAWYLHLSDSVARIMGDLVQEKVSNQMIRCDALNNAKKYNEARSLLAQIGSLLYQNPYPPGLVKYKLACAMADTGMHRFAAARDTLISALQTARDSKEEIYITLSLQALAAVQANLNNYKEAYRYQQEYLEHKDSLTNQETKARLADFEVLYQAKQKEEKIALLQQENDIKNLQLKSSRQTNILYGVIFLSILSVLSLLFWQRSKQQRLETDKVKAELQTQVLRSQMNPHFIFNCLNSIENFIMQNDKRMASDYLNKFSKLIRSILDSSRNEVVPLAKDMEALQLYVELEQLRFNHKFSFTSFVDPALCGGDYCVPSLLVQPFVENAIVHGLAHSEEEKLNLTVTASLENDTIKYIVQDNGIGRKKAKTYQELNKPYHKSVGLKITEERINMFNQQSQAGEFVSITDLYDGEQHPKGTKVEILLKAV